MYSLHLEGAKSRLVGVKKPVDQSTPVTKSGSSVVNDEVRMVDGGDTVASGNTNLQGSDPSNSGSVNTIPSVGVSEGATLAEGSDGTIEPNTGVTQNSERGIQTYKYMMYLIC